MKSLTVSAALALTFLLSACEGITIEPLPASEIPEIATPDPG